MKEQKNVMITMYSVTLVKLVGVGDIAVIWYCRQGVARIVLGKDRNVVRKLRNG
jgi:hypothetical protein